MTLGLKDGFGRRTLEKYWPQGRTSTGRTKFVRLRPDGGRKRTTDGEDGSDEDRPPRRTKADEVCPWMFGASIKLQNVNPYGQDRSDESNMSSLTRSA